jgi:hypothetical protein
MTAARCFFVAALCAGLSLSALVAPDLARADSNGVPPLAGSWTGKLTDTYFDQTSGGSVHPKQHFKSKVGVVIAQVDDAVTITINFQDIFPVNSGAGVSTLVLDGFAGNYHVNAAMDAGPSVTLSGATNRSGSSLTLNGIVASTEFTHEITIKLKKQNP